MDWQGQKRAEELMQYMLIGFGIVALFSGYFVASFRLMMVIYAGGLLLTMLVTVPNWPCFNKNGLKWLDPKFATEQSKPKPTPLVVPKKSKASRK